MYSTDLHRLSRYSLNSHKVFYLVIYVHCVNVSFIPLIQRILTFILCAENTRQYFYFGSLTLWRNSIWSFLPYIDECLFFSLFRGLLAFAAEMNLWLQAVKQILDLWEWRICTSASNKNTCDLYQAGKISFTYIYM